jgi:hypothetical protein
MANPKAMDAFCQEFEGLLRVLPPEFILNMDETGCANFVDARNESVIVPATYEDGKSAIPVLKALIIVPRKTLETEMQLCGYGGEHVHFVYEESGFVSTTIFEAGSWSSYFPMLRRTGAGLDEPATHFRFSTGASATEPGGFDKRLT